MKHRQQKTEGPTRKMKIKKGIKKPLCLAMMLLCETAPLFAADLDMPEIQLENVTITDRLDTTTYLPQTDFERKSANNLWEAVKGVPGVFQGESAGRGEDTITIRGSSRYQIGMYVDDIPVATAYRNEWAADNACCSILNPSISPKVFRLRFSEAITGWREQSISKRRNRSKIWISRPNIRIISTAIPTIRDA